jgi:outer membrane protein, heavy metal efflux system
MLDRHRRLLHARNRGDVAMNRSLGLLAAAVLAVPVCGLSEILDDWIGQAVERNPRIAAAHAGWQSALQRVRQERSLADPMIGADLMRSGTTRFDDYNMTEWMISQPLPWFGKRGARAAAAALDAQAAGLEYVNAVRELRTGVASAFWDLWAAQNTLKTAEENLQYVEQFEQAARARYESQPSGQMEVLRAQIERTRMSNDVQTLRAQTDTAASAVNALLDAPSSTPRNALDLAEPSLELELQPDRLLSAARERDPALLALGRVVEARKKALRAARFEYAPELEFRINARQMRDSGNIEEYDTGVQMNIPWLWRGKYAGMIRAAESELRMAESERRDAENELAVRIRQLCSDADAAGRIARSFENDVLAKSRQLVEATRGAYQGGQATFFELNDALRALIENQREYFRAKADLGRSVAELQKLVAPFSDDERATGLIEETEARP